MSEVKGESVLARFFNLLGLGNSLDVSQQKGTRSLKVQDTKSGREAVIIPSAPASQKTAPIEENPKIPPGAGLGNVNIEGPNINQN